MIERTLGEITEMAGGRAAESADLGMRVRGVTKDTRNIPSGSLYIPIIGERFDGHEFVERAFELGAAAAFWQSDHGKPPAGRPVIVVDDTVSSLQKLAAAYRRSLNVKVVGVTGSNGKTTTKDMTAAALGAAFRVHKTQGNLNNHIGLPLTLLELSEETETAVIEMGMSGRGEIALLTELAAPDAAIITNIGESHLLQLGSRKEIARAKLEILVGLRDGGLFIYNGDEPLIMETVDEMPQPASMRTLSFGSGSGNDLYPLDIRMEGAGTTFRTNRPDSPEYYIPLLGRHNVVNALAAIAAAEGFGVGSYDIGRGLRSLQMTGMRIERIEAGSGALILNDAYNASPTSMRAAIRLLEELGGFRRKWVVLGDMLELGDGEAEFHRAIGRELDPDRIDRVFAYGPLAKGIAEEAEPRFGGDSRVAWFADKSELIKELAGRAGAGDVILVKGSRGMKLEDVVHALRQAAVQ